MKSYKVFRNVAGQIPAMVYNGISNLQRANEYATALEKKTGDKCYVVEYQTRVRTIRSHHQHRRRTS